jgi:hypothetical protein
VLGIIMLVNEISREAIDFATMLSNPSKIPIELGELLLTDPIADPKNADLRKHGLANSSGLYFLVRPSGDVAYIGKATKGNLHPELWGKLRTPVGEFAPLTYPNTYWSGMDMEPSLAEELLHGEMRIAAFSVQPDWACSLLEVYLQTLCVQIDGALPCWNSQIG